MGPHIGTILGKYRIANIGKHQLDIYYWTNISYMLAKIGQCNYDI